MAKKKRDSGGPGVWGVINAVMEAIIFTEMVALFTLLTTPPK